MTTRSTTDLILNLLRDLAELESQRDKIGRHTNVSAHFEALMTTHEELFRRFQVDKKPPVKAL